MKENYQPFLIGHRFRIQPPNQPIPDDDHMTLLMERGAFGSGEHETTDNCLRLLEEMPFTGRERVLDLGSGTGILAIATLLLGAGKAWCVDIEEAAVENCQINCTLNGVGDKAEHLCGTLDQLDGGHFDLLLANIYGDILLDVAEKMVGLAAPGAHLLLSGILWQDNFAIRQQYQRLGCTLEKNQMLSEFSTVLLKKP